MSRSLKIGLGLVGIVLVGGAVASFGPSLGQWGILLPMLLLCPLMHLFMMRGMHGSHNHSDTKDASTMDKDASPSGNGSRSGSCH